MTGKMTEQKSGIPLVVFLPQLCQESEKEKEKETEIETEKETETETEIEKEKVKKKRPRGELIKIGNPFVVLKMRLMKTGGPRYDVKSQDNGFTFLCLM